MGSSGTPSGATASLAARLRAEFSSRLARDSLAVLGVSALGRAVAMGKEVLVAALFGVGGQLDAFVLALLAPSFLVNLLGASFSAALVPALGAATAGPGGEDAARRLLGRALLVLAGFICLACLVLAVLPAQLLQLLAPGAGAEQLALVKSMQLALLPLLAAGSLAQVLAASLNHRGRFASPAFTSTLGALATIGVIALLHGRLGIHALVAGAGAGAVLELSLLGWLARRAWGPLFQARSRGPLFRNLRPLLRDVRPLVRNWGLIALGTGLLGLTPFIDNAIASSLGEGAISALSYAWKLPSGIAGLLGLTLSTVLLPYFTAVVHRCAPSTSAGGQPDALAAACRRITKRLLLVSVPLAAVGVAASPLLVSLLFQRGRFDAAAAGQVSLIQACYFVQLPFYLLAIAGARMLQAASRLRLLLILQAGLLVVNALTSLLLSRVFGPAGIALSSAVMYALSAAVSLRASLGVSGQRPAQARKEPGGPAGPDVDETALRPLRVALVISSLGLGGAERSLCLLAGGLARRGHEVHVLSFDTPDAAPFFPLDAAVRLHGLDLNGTAGSAWGGLRANARRVARLRGSFRALKPDVALGFMDTTNVLCLLAGLGLGLPAIATEHTDPDRHDIGRAWNFLRRLSYPLAARVTTQTEAVRARLPGRVSVIPNPVAAPAPDTQADTQAGTQDRQLLALGRLAPEKGFDLLLAAFASLATSRPRWRLTILGEGPERTRLEAQRRSLGLEDRVDLPGAVRDPGPWLRRADIFVLSSRFEGFSNALCEALAHGLPAVAFDCPSGPAEIVRPGVDGLLVPEADVPALAAALARLMDDEALRLGMAARAPEVLERFGLEKVLDLWEALFLDVTAKKRSPA
ncbi:MAG TPA: lipid II flippase MurJ [Humidesulfovibrio sp.]|uniref:lipid II flippase MurJ n=1 Tax=Humidesulfovibrio sp. TaxID=2910988 RepID=UPI002BFD1759|nr:lipid II flippase MurJ [Humidesulfovibrio sp.]HWR03274.1 lipid II flippase MurJ [Humidesulfovibrio sp.]